MSLHVPRLAYFSVVVILAALVLPQVYWLWLETRTFAALDMPVSLSKGEIRTPDFPVNLRGWYHIAVWVDSDFSGCWSGLYPLALVSRSTAYADETVIDSSEGRDRYLGHFYASRKGRYRVTIKIASEPSCLNSGHPRIGVWTESSGYVRLYDDMGNGGLVVSVLCLGVLAYSFSSGEREPNPLK